MTEQSQRMNAMTPDTELIDSATTEEIATISRRTIDRLEKLDRFPKRVKIGYRTVRWVRREVEEWKRAQIQARASGDHSGDHA